MDVQLHIPKSMRRRCRTCRSVCWWSSVLPYLFANVRFNSNAILAEFNLSPLSPGYVYLGPSVANANSCRCSSVYYSLLSACAYCQGRNYLKWSAYNSNCSTVYSSVFTQQIPVGVKVQAWAYQNVDVADNFNVTLAQTTKGTESSRAAAASSTRSTKISTGGPSSTGASASDSSSVNVPAIVGGVVGGVVGLGLIGGLIAFLIVQRKKASSKSYQPGFQPQNMTYTPNTTASLVATTTSPGPGSPGRVYDPNDPTTYPAVDGHNTGGSYAGADPYRQQSPFGPQSIVTNYTGNSAQQYMPASQNMMPTMPTPSTPNRYTGAPEL
jgi:hypothetical protein